MMTTDSAEADALLADLEGKILRQEEQAKRLKEVAQKLIPSEARENAQACAAAAERLLREAEGVKAGLGDRSTKLLQRAEKACNQAAHMRTLALLKESRAMEALRVQVSLAVHAHLASKRQGSEDLLSIADVDRDGAVSREEFFALVEDCEGKFTLEQLGRLYDSIDQGRKGKLAREDFMCALRVFYKVSRPKVELYQTMGVSQGRKVRALDIDEVVELIEGPVKEANGSVRVKCRAMKDGSEGWTVELGNTGTAFLCQAQIHFKVVKETVLTTAFRLDSDECRTIRNLDVNELLAVQAWEQLDENSGVKRLKCKANKDGAVGWVSTVTNTGTQLLEIV